MAYVPILKGKRGEFTALGNIDPKVQEDIRPVLEIVPDGRLRDVLETFLQHAVDHLPKGLAVAVDCGSLWHAGRVGGVFTGHSMNWLGEAFGAWFLPMVPVFRPHDPIDALSEVREAHRTHGRGAVLRLDVFGLPEDLSIVTRKVRETLSTVKLTPEQVSLILDAGYVAGDTEVTQALPAMLHALYWARTAPWRHIATASGAFPRTLAGLPQGRPNRLHRWDATLWAKVAGTLDGHPPDFADYGVGHPAMPKRGWRGKPNLRYTVGDDWQVYIESDQRPDNDGFFTICENLLNSPDWPEQGEATSWGDAHLARCARRERPKAGGATQWRAWATSHHLAVVTDSLRSMGKP